MIYYEVHNLIQIRKTSVNSQKDEEKDINGLRTNRTLIKDYGGEEIYDRIDN